MKLKKKIIRNIKQSRRLRKLALKAYSIKHPPPYRRPNMEFEFDAWNGISSLRCWNGHQIGEENTGPYPYDELTRNEHKTCPFRDSRKGLPMNVETLRITMPSAEDALRLIAVLRGKYIAHRRLDTQRFNLARAYLFSKFAVSLPAYLTRRRRSPVSEGGLQPIETAFYMLGTAPFMLTRRLMSVGDPTPLDPRPMSAQRLYELADRSNALLSVRSCACPATPKLIRHLFDIMMNGNIDEPRLTCSARVQRVLDTLGDWKRYYDYTHASSRIELYIRLNLALTARILHGISKHEACADTHLVQRVLRTLLNRIQVRRRVDVSIRDILDNFIDILILLVKDHQGDTVLDSLNAAGCLDPLAFTHAPRETAGLIRRQHDLIHAACSRDIARVHRTLGYPDWPDITLEALYLRTGGSDLMNLTDRL